MRPCWNCWALTDERAACALCGAEPRFGSAATLIAEAAEQARALSATLAHLQGSAHRHGAAGVESDARLAQKALRRLRDDLERLRATLQRDGSAGGQAA